MGAGFLRRSDLEPGWQASLVEHLAAVVEKTPSLQVVLYGADRNGSVLLNLDFNDYEWLVLASRKPL